MTTTIGQRCKGCRCRTSILDDGKPMEILEDVEFRVLNGPDFTFQPLIKYFFFGNILDSG